MLEGRGHAFGMGCRQLDNPGPVQSVRLTQNVNQSSAPDGKHHKFDQLAQPVPSTLGMTALEDSLPGAYHRQFEQRLAGPEKIRVYVRSLCRYHESLH
jgi:hypothetical protein